MRFQLILQDDRLEVRKLWGVRVLKLPELASRRVVTLQRVKYLELSFKNTARKPCKFQWVFSVDERLQAFLNHLPDADEQAAKSLDEEIRADARLGNTPEERVERFKRTTQFLQKAIYFGPALLFWSAWYPHPYWLLIAALVMVPWACVLALRIFPGVLQIGSWRRGRTARPDITAPLGLSILALVIRALADVPTLDWVVELRWAAIAAAIFGAALYWAGTGQPRKWSTVALLLVLCGAYGLGSTVDRRRDIDHSAGETYRTQLVGKHFTSGRNRSYKLKSSPGQTPRVPMTSQYPGDYMYR